MTLSQFNQLDEMKQFINILRFIIYIPLCVYILYPIHYAILYFGDWLTELSLFWLLIVIFWGIAINFAFGMRFFGFLTAMLSIVNPYKKLSGWVFIPIANIWAILSIYITIMNIDYIRHPIVFLYMCGLITYTTIAFSFCISSSNYKRDPAKNNRVGN